MVRRRGTLRPVGADCGRPAMASWTKKGFRKVRRAASAAVLAARRMKGAPDFLSSETGSVTTTATRPANLVRHLAAHLRCDTVRREFMANRCGKLAGLLVLFPPIVEAQGPIPGK